MSVEWSSGPQSRSGEPGRRLVYSWQPSTTTGGRGPEDSPTFKVVVGGEVGFILGAFKPVSQLDPEPLKHPRLR
jgi:hypothetical protein